MRHHLLHIFFVPFARRMLAANAWLFRENDVPL